MQRSVHDEDGGHHVVVGVASRLAKPLLIADVNLGDVLHLDGDVVHLRENDAFDVLDADSLGDFRVAAAVDEAHAADVDRLLADIDGAGADVEVGVADGGDELRNGDAVAFELVQIGLDLELFRGSAPGVDLNDARHVQKAQLQHPVLDRAEVCQPEVGRTGELVAEDFPDKTRSLDLRLDVVRQADILRDVQLGLFKGEIIIDVIVKCEADEGKTVKRGGANVVKAGRNSKADFERDRIKPLHLLRGQTGRLSGNLQYYRRRIRVGFNIQP